MGAPRGLGRYIPFKSYHVSVHEESVRNSSVTRARIRRRVGPTREAPMTELEDIAVRIAGRLIERGETVAVAESSAGGLISAALLAVPGASKYFVGGAVVYTRAARKQLLGLTRRSRWSACARPRSPTPCFLPGRFGPGSEPHGVWPVGCGGSNRQLLRRRCRTTGIAVSGHGGADVHAEDRLVRSLRQHACLHAGRSRRSESLLG